CKRVESMSHDSHDQRELGSPGSLEPLASTPGASIDSGDGGVSRREFLPHAAAGTLGGAVALAPACADDAGTGPSQPGAAGPVALEINGQRHELRLELASASCCVAVG